MATRRDLSSEILRYRQAQALLELGLRVPVVCEMTRLSHWFLRKLAVEIHGAGPAKGQVPNSELWYLRGRNNLHASLFLALYRPLRATAGPGVESADLLIAAFQRYREVVEAAGLPEVLSPDRAWWLLKSLRVPTLKRVVCHTCGGLFLMHHGDLEQRYKCVCCLTRRSRQQTAGPAPGLPAAEAAGSSVTGDQTDPARGRRPTQTMVSAS
jgi:flagellar transcriptional activator FlhC